MKKLKKVKLFFTHLFTIQSQSFTFSNLISSLIGQLTLAQVNELETGAEKEESFYPSSLYSALFFQDLVLEEIRAT